MSNHLIFVSVNEADCTVSVDLDDEHGKPTHKYFWICDQGDVEINFNKGDGTPFDNGAKFTGRKGHLTNPGAKVRGSAVGGYRYSIKVKLDGSTVCERDPRVIIDPVVQRFGRIAPSGFKQAVAVSAGIAIMVWTLNRLLKKS